MKKILTALVLSFLLTAAFTSCGNGNNEPITPDTSASEGNTSENKTEISDPLTLLNNVWAAYGDEEKFPAAGGDFSEENNKMDAPGKYSLEDAEAVDAALGFPQASVGKIEDAASLTHMMNANTFTSAAYKVKEGEDVSAVINDIKTNILARQWMCGFPDKLIIASTDNYVISAFGHTEIMDTFKSKLTSVYSSVKIDVEENIEG